MSVLTLSSLPLLFLILLLFFGYCSEKTKSLKRETKYESIAITSFICMLFSCITFLAITSHLELKDSVYTTKEIIELTSIHDIEVSTGEEPVIKIKDGITIKEYLIKDDIVKYKPSDTIMLELGVTEERSECWIFYDTINKNTYTIYLPKEYIPTIE